ncbi:MAG: P1 family peptidase [Acidobacteria bacterium]|nr:P1 family peptidase [Acidobacteriota bacterium]
MLATVRGVDSKKGDGTRMMRMRRVWQLRQFSKTMQPWGLPVVAETWDGRLNDISGFHVKQQHVFDALDNARSGSVATITKSSRCRTTVCERF